MWPRYNRPEIFDEINQFGYFIKDGEKVGLGLLYDLRDSNLLPFIEQFRCPTLIIHGSNDQRINKDSSISGINYFGVKRDLKIIPGASHSFKPELDFRPTVFNSTTNWFNSSFPTMDTANYRRFL